MWQDVATERDFLNFDEIADLCVDLLKKPHMLPLSLGVFGGWGSGKSTLLNLIEQSLGEDEQFIVVEFDAWMFQGFDDARAALLEEISKCLIEAAKANAPLHKKALGLMKRINYLRIVGTAVDVGASIAFGLPTFGMFGRGLESAANFVTGGAADADREQVQKALVEATKSGEGGLLAEKTTPPTQIRAFREEFHEVLKGLDKTVVVFIDNLDRCLPAAAIQTMEAIRLFLFLPKTAFIIAADESVIQNAVSKHFDGLSSRHVKDYLDKLIQVPVRTPRLGIREVRAYMFLLYIGLEELEPEEFSRARLAIIDNLRASWKSPPITRKKVIEAIGRSSSSLEARLDVAERLAPILATAPNILGNPRIVKRLLNSLGMRLAIAERRGIPADEAVLSKLAVLERVTDESTYAFLLKSIVDDRAGKPEIISKLESSVASDTWDAVCPQEWKGQHEPLLRTWCGLEPRLGGLDLRTAVYLSRDNFPVGNPPGELSFKGVQAVAALRCVDSTSSKAGRGAVDALSVGERVTVFEALLGELRRVEDWSTPPSGLHGAFVLANSTPDVQSDFCGFLRKLPTAQVPPWLDALTGAFGWTRDVVSRWRAAEDGPAKRGRRVPPKGAN